MLFICKESKYFLIFILLLITSCTPNSIVNSKDNFNLNSIVQPKITFKSKEKVADISIKKYAFRIEGRKKKDNSILHFLNINFDYPQIEGLGNKFIENKVNEALINIPLSIFEGDTYEDKLQTFQRVSEKDDGSTFGASMDYQITLLNEDYLSVAFAGLFFNGARVYSIENVATIDLKTGNYIHLEDIVDIDSLITIIDNCNFELIEGSYTGFGTGKEPGRIKEFIDLFCHVFKYANRDNSKFINNDVNNFCTDGNNLYVYFSYPDSLNGYVILKLKLDDVENKLSIVNNGQGIFSELQKKDSIYK